MASEFNYERAHREWALPEWEKLPNNIKELYRKVDKLYNGVNQNDALGMDWISDELEAEFAAIDMEELANAARVIHALGRWDYAGAGDWPRSKHGGHWKFQLLAQQTLAKYGCGESSSGGRSCDVPNSIAERFMDHKPGTEYDNKELVKVMAPLLRPLFEVVACEQVNHRPHPFMIGPKHLEKSGMVLDPNVAPCAMRGCGLPYSEHTSEKALILKRARYEPENKLREEEVQMLESIKPVLEEHKIDGFGFIRGEQ